MKFKSNQRAATLLLLTLLLTILYQPSTLLAQGTAFTYQGRLTDGTNPANGNYDMGFYLRDALTGGNAVGPTNILAPVRATNGLFTVTLDFGTGIFTGPSRWLEIEVRTNGSGGVYTTLSPRQALTPSPYAIMAGNAGSLGGQSASAYVSKNGDTMTGTLNLPAHGLTVGGGQLVVAPNGGVGIGVANPSANLEVSGSNGTQERVTDTITGNSLVLQAGSGSNMKVTGYNYTTGAVPLYIGVDGANTILNSGGGNVGIGTASPAGALEVSQASSGITSVFGRGNDNNFNINFRQDKSGNSSEALIGQLGLSYGGGDNAAVRFHRGNGSGDGFLSFTTSNNTERVRIDRLGNVGIGTTSPQAALDIGWSFDHPTSISFSESSTDHHYISAYYGGLAVYNSMTFSIDNASGGTWPTMSLRGDGSALIQSSNTVTGGTLELRCSASGFNVNQGTIEFSDPNDNIYSKIVGAVDGSISFWVGYPSLASKVRIGGDGTLSVPVLQINGADVAEPFEISTHEAAKGSLMIIDEEHPGQLALSKQAYDNRVAGILSGANGVNSGILLSQKGFNQGGQNVALSGRVYALADASYAAIKPGDLLTTSDTPGHCMKVTDHVRAQGAIIGKAMSGLKEGKGMVLVLVSLQ